MSEFLQYLKEANANYYLGIESLYASATPQERVRIEDNRIALEQAITIIENTGKEPTKDAITKATVEKEYLEIYNRVKRKFFEAKRKKYIPTRAISKSPQLHSALKIYSLDEIGKVIFNSFSDSFHTEHDWKWVTTEYCTRKAVIEKYLT